ncbi:MAG: serine/threonine protein kinase, partial [Archangium sp.]|nr:serine/threonine protein kinase [Archangium sp.]
MSDSLEALLTTLGDQAETLVRRPRSTVEPPRDAEEGARALAQLRALAGQETYADEGLLGRGGMGVVRLSTQQSLNRKVAVKSLRPDRAGESEIEALVAEAWRTGRLEHPNILPVYSLRLLPDGQPELVMKRIEGRSWSEELRANPVFVDSTLRRESLSRHLLVLGQVCHALHFAHARGLVHRDVKPDNVMLGAFGEVYLVDWGIATAPGPARGLAGTPAYAAPEMLGGDGVLSAATDVYLLGAVLFEVLTGQPPHLRATPSEVLASILQSEPQLSPSVPRELTSFDAACTPTRRSDPRAPRWFDAHSRPSQHIRGRCCSPPRPPPGCAHSKRPVAPLRLTSRRWRARSRRAASVFSRRCASGLTTTARVWAWAPPSRRWCASSWPV